MALDLVAREGQSGGVTPDRWAAVIVAGCGVLVAAWIAIYVNGPWRKRITDEIAIRDAVHDEETRVRLTSLIETAAARYARRRAAKRWRRGLLAIGGLLGAAGALVAALLNPEVLAPVLVATGASVFASVVSGLAEAFADLGRTFAEGMRGVGRAFLDELRLFRSILAAVFRRRDRRPRDRD